jgi:hypothetical protein
MIFKEIMESLDKLSAYELRIIANTADKLIDNPDKLILIKNYLKPGMQIDYFCSTENREINAIIREVKKSYVSVVNTRDQKCCQVHFSNINLCSVDLKAPVNYKTGKVTQFNLSVGDSVGFEHGGQELVGTVIKLNPKRAKIKLYTGKMWNVPYKFLFYVLDGSCSIAQECFIEGEVLHAN